jgi:8-oxo-dGTP diphosphatase
MIRRGNREDTRVDLSAVTAPGRDQIVTALVACDGRVLLCHRSPGRRWYPDVWDLPGGHVEAGESPARALVREVHEELGVSIAEPSGPELARFVTAAFDMRVWLVRAWSGDLGNGAPAEHDKIGWFGVSGLAGLRLAHDGYLALITRVLAGQGGHG